MSRSKTHIYILYQIGASEDWMWFSPVGVFLSEKALWDHVDAKGIPVDRKILEPTEKNEVLLPQPQDFVIVRSSEGEVPDVDLEFQE
ncbi:MAG TPA: hypothetical protein VLY21_01740 [Nitrososphaerales archaeon]|nr:hypothetical protein [Nitrososphaerales archaeon]